uniref:Uncharacterized protein n=1 Tax=viral metagenome TaxID=1070528 RepID=A0A6C0ECL5_9ZZZZ
MDITNGNYLIHYISNASNFQIDVYNQANNKRYQANKPLSDYAMYKDIGLDICEIITTCFKEVVSEDDDEIDYYSINDDGESLTFNFVYKEIIKLKVTCDCIRTESQKLDTLSLKQHMLKQFKELKEENETLTQQLEDLMNEISMLKSVPTFTMVYGTRVNTKIKHLCIADYLTQDIIDKIEMGIKFDCDPVSINYSGNNVSNAQQYFGNVVIKSDHGASSNRSKCLNAEKPSSDPDKMQIVFQNPRYKYIIDFNDLVELEDLESLIIVNMAHGGLDYIVNRIDNLSTLSKFPNLKSLKFVNVSSTENLKVLYETPSKLQTIALYNCSIPFDKGFLQNKNLSRVKTVIINKGTDIGKTRNGIIVKEI